MPGETIFDEIKALYGKHNFAEEVKSYFTNKFFTTAKGAVQLDEEKREEFNSILDKAIRKLEKEEDEAEKLKGSGIQRATRAIGRFIKDLSTLGLWRLFKTKTAKEQFEGLVSYATTLANNAVGPRESGDAKDAYEALSTQIKFALKEKVKPVGRLARNEDIRDKLVEEIADTCINELKKNSILDPNVLFNKHEEILKFVVDGVENGANKYLASWSPLASFDKQARHVASNLVTKLIKEKGSSRNPFDS